ncbi:MAG: NIPSNAP family protein [Candidatus Rokubacteria bacterium]|nr:NIPSNAP family protein [Candidatus Rokubacteria bacterium]
MIHELRTYTIHPGKLAQYVELAGSIGRPIRGDRFGKLVGYWTTELGPLNQVVHMWEYADLAARAQARAGLAKDERWTKEYVPKGQPLLQAQENTILTPMEWYPFRPSSGMGIYELRTYRLYPGKLAEWARVAQAGIATREKYSSPLGFWATEVGPLNTTVHIWPYRDLGHRAETRKAVAADPGWQEVVAKLGPLMQAQESKLLVPTPFSPLR